MYLVIILSIIFIFPLFPKTITLQNRLQMAKGGEFVVTEKDKILTVLAYHPQRTEDRMILEEISVPKNCLSFPMHWQNWINQYAPGHQSWTLFEINPHTGELISCFSPSKGRWLSVYGETQFLPQLLMLPLERISDCKKKRIGPPPKEGCEDYRQVWTPLLIHDGKIQREVEFDIYETLWPNDNTKLKLSRITLYFYKHFPFPYWTQIDNGTARSTVRVVDSGCGLQSIFDGMPRQNLICSNFERCENGLYRLSISSNLPSDTFRLYALERDISAPPIRLSSSQVQSENGYFLIVTEKELERVLLKTHFYYFMVIPMGYPGECAKTTIAWHYVD